MSLAIENRRLRQMRIGQFRGILRACLALSLFGVLTGPAMDAEGGETMDNAARAEDHFVVKFMVRTGHGLEPAEVDTFELMSEIGGTVLHADNGKGFVRIGGTFEKSGVECRIRLGRKARGKYYFAEGHRSFTLGKPGESVTVLLKQKVFHHLSVKTVSENGEQMRDSRIIVFRKGEQTTRELRNGRIRLRRGEYRVVARAEGYRVGRDEVVIRDADISRRLTLKRARRITIRILDAAGKPIVFRDLPGDGRGKRGYTCKLVHVSKRVKLPRQRLMIENSACTGYVDDTDPAVVTLWAEGYGTFLRRVPGTGNEMRLRIAKAPRVECALVDGKLSAGVVNGLPEEWDRKVYWITTKPVRIPLERTYLEQGKGEVHVEPGTYRPAFDFSYHADGETPQGMVCEPVKIDQDTSRVLLKPSRTVDEFTEIIDSWW